MILTKMHRFILVLSVFFFVQCYTDPFFELTVTVIDSEMNPVPGAIIKIEVVDIDNGTLVEGSVIDLESTTGSSGSSFFSFENKAFVTARACIMNPTLDTQFFCKEGFIYLEADMNKNLTLMLESDSCLYCF